MEVHKHPHHVTHKKKWGEYLLEFLMLFLAVFLGFIAENIRESNVDKHKEKQYMHSMVEDLRNDSSLLQRSYNRIQKIVNKIDTVTDILYFGNINDSTVKLLYRLNLEILPSLFGKITDRTLSQLKNAGGMRLNEDTAVVNHLFNYWGENEFIIASTENYNQLRLHARDLSYKIFNQKYIIRLKDTSIHPGKAVLMTTDPLILIEFANRIDHYKNSIINLYLPALKMEISNAEKLIGLIKKEYHLENE